MSTILEELVDYRQTALGKSQDRTADSLTSTSHQTDQENWSNPGPAARGPAESFRWFSERFDGLRIPSSPLHEF